MFEYFLLVSTLFFLFLLCSSLRDIVKPYYARSRIFTDPDEKLLVFQQGEDLQIEGGEAEPDFYYKAVVILTQPGEPRIVIEFICGAVILVEKKHESVLGGRLGKTKNMYLYHPLFEFAHRHPDRLRLLLRTRREKHEKHYSVGTSPGLICEEDEHQRGGQKTGTFYYNDVRRWQILKRRIKQNRRKCVVWNKDVEVPFEVMD